MQSIFPPIPGVKDGLVLTPRFGQKLSSEAVSSSRKITRHTEATPEGRATKGKSIYRNEKIASGGQLLALFEDSFRITFGTLRLSLI